MLLFTVWVPGSGLRSLDLATSVLTCEIMLPAPHYPLPLSYFLPAHFFLSPFLSPTRLPFTLRSVYMCRVSEHVRAHSRVPPQRRGTSGACSDSVYLILLRHGFLLNVELGWQPASSSDSPVSAPHRACVISVCSHAGLVPWLMGF